MSLIFLLDSIHEGIFTFIFCGLFLTLHIENDFYGISEDSLEKAVLFNSIILWSI